MPELPFEFEPLIESWATTHEIEPALPAIRAFLNTHAASVVSHLPDSQLHWALAAWQREGELNFAQMKYLDARLHYEALGTLLTPHHPLLGLWCAGAVAECRVALGEVADGLADLAEVLEALEELGHTAGIEALSLTIAEIPPP